jgi:FkbM family methyltransferase
MRRPLKTESLRKILSLGVPINTILDVGVLTGTAELMEVFRGQHHVLVEPIEEWNHSIKQNYASQGIEYTLINAAASDEDGFMNIETSTVIPGKPISHAYLTQKSTGDNIRNVRVAKVDTLVRESSFPSPYLLKIDVDGVEMAIMRGALETFARTTVIVIEANIKNFIERSSFLLDHGFELFDVVDPCYYDDRLRQFDLIFLNSNTVRDLDLDMYKQPFDFSKWVNYA